MILKKLAAAHKNQQGITLIEMLVGLVAMGVIIFPVAMGTIQIINGSGLSNNSVVAVSSVQNAGDWMSRDARMATIVSPSSGSYTLGNLTLTWTDHDAKTNTVVYNVTGGELRRSYSVSSVNNGTPTVTTVARNVSVSSSYASASKLLTLTITASVGGGRQAANETRTYEIRPRGMP